MSTRCFALLLALSSLACQSSGGGFFPLTDLRLPPESISFADRGIDGQNIDIRPATGLRVLYAQPSAKHDGPVPTVIDLQNFDHQAIFAVFGSARVLVPAATEQGPGETRFSFDIEENNASKFVKMTSGELTERIAAGESAERSRTTAAPLLAPRTSPDSPTELVLDVDGVKVTLQLQKSS